MSPQLSSSAQRVQSALEKFNLDLKVLELPDSTRTAQDAAGTIGCEVGQIAKSLVFRAKDTSRAVLVITSGINRVDEAKVSALIGEPLVKADPEFVRSATGFAIGGIPPVGHLNQSAVFIDEDLFAFNEIWAAAGTPRSVFKLSPADLEKITSGRVCCVKI